MNNQIKLEHFKSEYFDLLEETFEQVHGYYLDQKTSIFETLNGISADEASWSVSKPGGTIAAHTEHMRFYLQVLMAYLLKERTEKVDWSQSWLVKRVTNKEWDELRQQLKSTYKAGLNMLQNFDGWEDENGIADPLSILVHSAHHLGEIRQMAGAVKLLYRNSSPKFKPSAVG